MYICLFRTHFYVLLNRVLHVYFHILIYGGETRVSKIFHTSVYERVFHAVKIARETSPKKQSAESIIAVGRVEEIKYEKQRGRRNFTSFADFIKILISCTTFLFTPIQTLAAFQSFLRAVSFCG